MIINFRDTKFLAVTQLTWDLILGLSDASLFTTLHAEVLVESIDLGQLLKRLGHLFHLLIFSTMVLVFLSPSFPLIELQSYITVSECRNGPFPIDTLSFFSSRVTSVRPSGGDGFMKERQKNRICCRALHKVTRHNYCGSTQMRYLPLLSFIRNINFKNKSQMFNLIFSPF